MIMRRKFAGMLMALTVLAGCEATTSLEVATPLGSDLNVTAVSVDAGSLTMVVGRDFDRSAEGVAADVMVAVETALAQESVVGGRDVTVNVALKEVELANIASRIVAQASNIRADVTVTAADGSVVVPTQEVVGNSAGIRLAGTLGAVTTPTVMQDYQDTVLGFSQTLQKLIFPE